MSTEVTSNGKPGQSDAILTVEEERANLRAAARATVGVTDVQDDEAPPLRQTLKRAGIGLYPLLALGALAIIDLFQAYGFAILGPEVARTLGMSKGAVAGLVALKLASISIAALVMAAYVQNRPRRHWVAIVTAFMWAAVCLGTGFVSGLIGLFVVLMLDGVSSGSTEAVHQPLLMDTYPPDARVRVFSFYRAAVYLGSVIAPLMVAVATGVFGLTWRGVFLVMGITAFGAAFFTVRLKDPGFGRWDTGRVRELVRGRKASEERAEVEERTQLRFFEIVRRLQMIPTQRMILLAFAVLGVMLIPFQTFFYFFLDERWGMGPEGRAVFSAFLAAVAAIALVGFAHKGEEIFRRDPPKLIRSTAYAFLVMIAMIVIGALMPVFALMALFMAGAFCLIAIVTPAFYVALLAIVPPPMRPHASALVGIYEGVFGGLLGAVMLGSVDRHYGIAGALVALAIPGVIGALVLRAAAKTVNDDLNRMIDEVVEEEEIKMLAGAGTHLPLLSCRHIDFSYGQVQVLFDVSFSVDQGEMVALLGTNGAGKSTLLRVISGLGLPSRGSVRLYGADITFLDAERRLGLGVSQIPGRSIFGPLSVVENLKLLSYSHGRNGKAIDEGIEASFEAFPVLAERRNQAAQTLSGGEQQMLALCKALILKPRLLLIDELSLGLAPAVIASLLETVRTINKQGTAVVLVEQSVNIALSIVQHAYFMERGQIRFDGPAEELIGRADLLRSVFLHGAAAAEEMR